MIRECARDWETRCLQGADDGLGLQVQGDKSIAGVTLRPSVVGGRHEPQDLAVGAEGPLPLGPEGRRLRPGSLAGEVEGLFLGLRFHIEQPPDQAPIAFGEIQAGWLRGVPERLTVTNQVGEPSQMRPVRGVVEMPGSSPVLGQVAAVVGIERLPAGVLVTQVPATALGNCGGAVEPGRIGGIDHSIGHACGPLRTAEGLDRVGGQGRESETGVIEGIEGIATGGRTHR